MRRRPDYRRIVALERATGLGPERDPWVPFEPTPQVPDEWVKARPLPWLVDLNVFWWPRRRGLAIHDPIAPELIRNHYVEIAHRRRVAANVAFFVATTALFWTYVGWLILSQGGS